MYAGAGEVSLASGIGPASTQHDLPVRYLGSAGATFSIDVSPDSAGLDAGTTRQFTAVARDINGTELTGFAFQWSSSRPDVASVNATTGLVTAVSIGRAHITASSGGISGSAVVTVGPPGAGVPVAVVVTPVTGLLSIGDSLSFHAVAVDALGAIVAGTVFSWKSSNAVVAAVSQSGVATARAVGTTAIVASLGALADTAILDVVDSGGPGVASIVVTPATSLLTSLGATQQFTAVATDAQGNVVTGATLQWASSNTSVASISGTGVATALAAGVTTITASANGLSGSATLAVTLGAPGPPTFIVVLPGTATLTAIGDVQTFTAIALDAQGRAVPGVVFAWTSSNPAIASITASSGLATAVSPGAVNIIASAAGVSGAATLTVSPVIRSITVAPTAASVFAGEATTFSAVARDANGHVIAGTTFAWSTSDPSIATVSATGVATGVGGGNTLVRATAGGISGSGALTVIAIGSIDIQLAQESEMKVGHTIQYTAVVRDVAGNVLNGVTVTWSSSVPAVAAIVTGSGLATGISPGICFIRARAGNLTDEVMLLVKP